MTNTAAAPAKSNKTLFYYLNSVVTILIMFGFGYLPAIEPITPLGMDVLGIFIALLYGWTFVDQIWPSILGMVALSLTHYMSLNQLMAAGFGSNTIMLMWFMLIIAALVDSAGVSKFLATYFITRKPVLGKPWVLITTFFFTTFIISAMTSTVPAIIVCWGILYSIVKQLGYKAGDSFTSFMVVGVVFCCLIGLSLLPWKTVQMVVLGMFETMAGYKIDYLKYVAVTFPVSIVAIILYVLVGKFIFKPDVKKLELVTEDSFDSNDLKIDFKQKIIIGLLVALVFFLLIPSLLPGSWAVTKVLKGLGAHGIAFLVLGVLVFLRFNDIPMINIRKCCGKMQWDSIYLTAAMLPFANALNAEATGINSFLIEKFNILFSGISPVLFIFLVIVLAMIATQFMNNAICGGIMFPIIYPFALAIDLDPGMITVLLIYCLVMAVLTPAASPMAALMFANTEWVSTREVYKYITPGILIVFVSVCVVGIPIAYMVFR